MRYEYSGYLSTILDAPDPEARDSLECVRFTADDIAQWALADDEAYGEWQHIPATVERTAEGVLLVGHFEDVRRIDHLDRNDPSFWVPLSTMHWRDARCPIETAKYPIAEITYRCHTPMARPAWVWHYPGGMHFDGLQPVREWRTIARRIPHFGFPAQVDRLTVRLYSTARSREALEIAEIRFRAPTPEEAEACSVHYEALLKEPTPRRYPLLDSFMPAGVYMKAGSAKRLAEIMDISFHDYWRLAIEDVARHFHNCIVLEEVEEISAAEWADLLVLAETYDVRLIPTFNWSMDAFDLEGPALIEKHIRPNANSSAILGWNIHDEPAEHSFPAMMRARPMIAAADPNHPMVIMMRDPDAFALFAPFFAVSGMTHFKSHAASELGALIRTHRPLSRGSQFWVLAPAFVYATDTPEWNTCPEMRLLINHAYAAGARGWFTFTYHNDPIWMGGHCQRSLTGPFLCFSDLWSELGERMERFQALAPILLHSVPVEDPGLNIRIAWKEHPKARHAPDVESIEWHWLHGQDFALLYLVSNDIAEVTSVNINVPDPLAGHQEIYDLTDYVRSRQWIPMERRRHLEMFPGQGQIFLIADPDVCERWRNTLAWKILEGGRRQIAIDLELARAYALEVEFAETCMREPPQGTSQEELFRSQAVRDQLLNAIYAAPPLIESRSSIIQASAGICGCDGALCRLLGMGKVDAAHELGLRLLPLTREMARLRLALRAGQGASIHAECVELAQQSVALLHEIRVHT
ncbi:MAG TPA: hypothetical protein ENN65_08590 [Candidatus Hydrogenedentes bacterium]|nr:hypothetical protein [Candidatus Hydrogenedentota bacterium]